MILITRCLISGWALNVVLFCVFQTMSMMQCLIWQSGLPYNNAIVNCLSSVDARWGILAISEWNIIWNKRHQLMLNLQQTVVSRGCYVFKPNVIKMSWLLCVRMQIWHLQWHVRIKTNKTLVFLLRINNSPLCFSDGAKLLHI